MSSCNVFLCKSNLLLPPAPTAQTYQEPEIGVSCSTQTATPFNVSRGLSAASLTPSPFFCRLPLTRRLARRCCVYIRSCIQLHPQSDLIQINKELDLYPHRAKCVQITPSMFQKFLAFSKERRPKQQRITAHDSGAIKLLGIQSVQKFCCLSLQVKSVLIKQSDFQVSIETNTVVFD